MALEVALCKSQIVHAMLLRRDSWILQEIRDFLLILLDATMQVPRLPSERGRSKGRQIRAEGETGFKALTEAELSIENSLVTFSIIGTPDINASSACLEIEGWQVCQQ